jgi:ribosomal protein S18 acetylase RimI-like enzyme
MKLLTKELLSKIPALYSQENEKDPMDVCKFFLSMTKWTWFATEFDGKDSFFGYVIGEYPELGYFSLSELESFTNFWNQDYEVLTSSRFKMTYEKAKEGFNLKLFEYIGLYKKELLVGFILLKNKGNEIWIKHLLIDKNERTKGLGKMLLKEAVGNKDENIFTEVINENQVALRFFLANKFQIIKEDKENNQFILKLQK